MAASKKILDYLNEHKVRYELLEHPVAFTAMEIADKQNVKGKQVVKSVIVLVDGKTLMCVLPAIHMIDFDSLKNVKNAETVELASEDQVADCFPEYEVGAEPPFGHLYGMDVLVDKFLENDDEILFNAGTHTDMIKIKYADYVKLVKPQVAEFGTHI